MSRRKPHKAAADYSRAERDRAAAAEDWATSEVVDNHAFLVRWGAHPEEDRAAHKGKRGNTPVSTEADLKAKCKELGALLGWWASKGPYAAGTDVEAVAGLERAMERLKWLHASAAVVERQMQEDGYEMRWVPKAGRRLMFEIGSPGIRGPKRAFFTAKVVEAFEALVEAGEPRRNTGSVRRKIAARLAETFPPTLLRTAKDSRLERALYAHLQGDRDRQARGKRKSRGDGA